MRARIPSLLSLVVVAVAAGCATTPGKEAGDKAKSAVFYPPPPEPPRVQYLKSYSSAADVGEVRSGFAEFIAGADPKKAQTVEKAYGSAIHGGKILVTDVRGGGYAVFDVANREYTFVVGDGNGRMKRPTSITIAPDGTRYVVDSGREQVIAFDSKDRYVTAYGTPGQFKPGGVAVIGDKLYVSDIRAHEVLVLDRKTGDVAFKIGKGGNKDGEFHTPTTLSLGADGNLYVADSMNFRIQKFTPEGKFVRVVGGAGTALGQFARPKGAAADKEGRIYAVDAGFENVQAFDPEGRLLLYFGSPGGAPENINLPTTVVLDYESAPLFQPYAAPGFKLEYVLLVASQFGNSKLNVYGFGKMDGVDYAAAERRAPPVIQPK
jgi:DNA-binding beta-propeller fold protein YncE